MQVPKASRNTPDSAQGSNDSKSTADHIFIAINFLLDSIKFWLMTDCLL